MNIEEREAEVKSHFWCPDCKRSVRLRTHKCGQSARQNRTEGEPISKGVASRIDYEIGAKAKQRLRELAATDNCTMAAKLAELILRG